MNVRQLYKHANQLPCLYNDSIYLHLLGLLETGFVPLPREMSFPSEDFEDWKKKYDYVKFPAEDGSKSFRDVIPGRARSPMQARKSNFIYSFYKDQA